MLMKALIKSHNKPGIWMESVPVPAVSTNEVLIKIHKTGICGTDLHIYNWDDWAQRNIQLPRVIGHEFVGEIVEIGPGAVLTGLIRRIARGIPAINIATPEDLEKLSGLGA